MLKSLVLIFCCVCVAVVLSESAAAFLLWQSGKLTAHHLKEIRLILTDGVATPESENEVPRGESQPSQPSLQEVIQSRAIKVLDLEKREGELAALKNMANENADRLDAQQKTFRTQQAAFETELARLEMQVKEAATEQARGVLLAMDPKDAVEKLMQLSLEEDVVLLRGMSEKSIAKILKEFGTASDQSERSRKIFESISRAAPISDLLRDTQQKFSAGKGVSAN